MRDSDYRRLFGETPRQRRIRHNWPMLCSLMTKAEVAAHVEGLRSHAKTLRSRGDRVSAEALEKSANSFEEKYGEKKRR